MSLKHLPPTLRKKQRYIVFKIFSKKEFEMGEVVNSLWKSLLEVLGEKGVGQADPWIMKSLFRKDSQIAGIKTDKNHVSDIKCALTLTEKISGEKVVLKVLGISGTMKTAKEKFMD